MKKYNNKVMAAVCCLTLLFAATAMTGCSKDDDNVNNSSTAGGGEKVTPQDSIIGSTPAPTNWTLPTDTYFYPMSMFVVLDNDGAPVVMHDGDMLAAFINGNCRGTATATTGTDNYTRIVVKISVTTAEATDGTSKQVELRYYTTHYKKVYTAQPFTFEEEAVLGLHDGYKPTWNK